MNSYVQLLALGFSFLYGIFFYLAASLNKYFIDNKSVVSQLVISLIFIIDIVIVYVYIMYKINLGIMHPYYAIVFCLGYLLVWKNKSLIFKGKNYMVNKKKKKFKKW